MIKARKTFVNITSFNVIDNKKRVTQRYIKRLFIPNKCKYNRPLFKEDSVDTNTSALSANHFSIQM